MQVKKYVVWHLDHSDNITPQDVNATGVGVTDTGDLIFMDANSKIITAFAKGRWDHFMQPEVTDV